MASYSFETKSVEKEYRAEDGTLMATAHYALPVLTASNAAGNKLETETITVRRVNSYFADWLSREEEWFSELGASAEGSTASSRASRTTRGTRRATIT